MANLRANKITSTEVFETTGSVQFTGTTSALAVPAGTDFAYGTGTFTIECFIYAPTLAATPGASYTDHHIFSQTVNGTNYLMLSYDPNGTLYWTNATSGGGTVVTTSSGVVVANKWQHIVASRDSNNILRMFVDGSVVYSGYNNFDFNDTTRNPTIGNYTHIYSQLPFTGHISNFRILKGTALYTKNFTPPTRELTVIPNTVLLACTSTTNTAQEATGKTITVNGNAVANELTPGLLTDVVKSGGTSAITGSVEFDGTGDYLSLADSTDLDLATGDFTIETWFYYSGSNNLYPTIFGNNPGAWTSGSIPVHIDHQSYPNKVTLWVNDYSGGVPLCTSQSIITYDSWNHLVISRSGTIIRLFYNGNLESQSTISSSLNFNMNIGSFRIGGGNWNGINGDYNGFISNLRIIKGTALYTGSFIPPSRELKKLPGTVLLCCKNSNDPTAEETGKTITANGDPAASNFTPQIGSDGSVTFDGVTKINTQNYFYIPTGNTENRGRGRGLFGGGDPGATNNISFIQIQSQGIAQDFGDLTQGRLGAGGFSSSSRGVFSSGYNAPLTNVNTIDYITISTTSNAVDFGDSTEARHEPGACSSSTRGVVGGGTNPGNSNVMDYVTTASLGNAQDFGDLTVARRNITSAQSPTRGIFFGGRVDPAGTAQNIIDYITIATTGNALDFGDLTTTRARAESVSNATRAVCIGGENPSAVTTMEYVTMSSTGNSVNFGTCSSGANNANNGASNSVRGVFHSASGNGNTLDYITIAATGNTTDFGDLNYGQTRTTAFSDSHGGIEG